MKVSKVLPVVVMAGAAALVMTACGTNPGTSKEYSTESSEETLTPELGDDTKDGSVMNRDITKMSVTQDASNLKVTFEFDGVPAGWECDAIGVAIYKDGDTSTAHTSEGAWWDSFVAYPTYSSNCTFLGVEILKAGVDTKTYDSDGNATGANMTSSVTWTQNSSTWAYEASASSVTYTIPLTNIGAVAGDDLYVVGAFGAYDWNTLSSNSRYIVDAVPASAFTLSTSEALAATESQYTTAKDTAAIDFSKGIEYTVE